MILRDTPNRHIKRDSDIKMIDELIDALEAPEDIIGPALDYLEDAPNGPYRDMVRGLVLRLHKCEGDLQDLKVDNLLYPVRLKINEGGSFIADARNKEWLEVFERTFLRQP